MMTAAGRRALEALRRARELGQLDLPWGGRSPRELTDAWKRFSLRQRDDENEGSASDEMVDEQCRRHQHGF